MKVDSHNTVARFDHDGFDFYLVFFNTPGKLFLLRHPLNGHSLEEQDAIQRWSVERNEWVDFLGPDDRAAYSRKDLLLPGSVLSPDIKLGIVSSFLDDFSRLDRLITDLKTDIGFMSKRVRDIEYEY